MSEYWKSTPKYWCKHCGIYVRDTKLERANHEASGKHQGAILRSLRDLHRNHEKEEREKDRAKREVERLNGVVSGFKPGHGFGAPGRPSDGGEASIQEERQRQLEQLAGLGVNIPTELRPEMALAGEWTVTSRRVIKDPDQEDTKDEPSHPTSRAAGVRKRDREQTEEEKEDEEALKTLFKKPKNWGRDTKLMPTEEDAELEELLGGSLVRHKKAEGETIKAEHESQPMVKIEGTHTADSLAAAAVKSECLVDPPPLIKQESGSEISGLPGDIPVTQEAGHVPETEPVVVFKKRKPKNVRQK